MKGRNIIWVGIVFMLGSHSGLAEGDYDFPGITNHVTAITLGSSTNEIVQLLGEPSQRNEDETHQETWRYGKSIITVQDGRISGWFNAGNPDLHVFLGEKKTNAPPFQRGSPAEAVIAAMGTPDGLTQLELLQLQNWYYGVARVTLVKGKVESWKGAGLKAEGEGGGVDVEKPLVSTRPMPVRTNLASSTRLPVTNRVWLVPVVQPVPIATNWAAPNYSRSPRSQAISTNTSRSTGGKVYVRGYTRKDGTMVPGHFRRKTKP